MHSESLPLLVLMKAAGQNASCLCWSSLMYRSTLVPRAATMCLVM